jgi:hypothetical protein
VASVKVVTCNTHQVDIWIGGRYGYTDHHIPAWRVTELITIFQRKHNPLDFCAVTVTETQYVVRGYNEPGWRISTINYPRFPKSVEFINSFMAALGDFLLDQLHQNRLTIVYPDKTVMLVADDAEEHPKP